MSIFVLVVETFWDLRLGLDKILHVTGASCPYQPMHPALLGDGSFSLCWSQLLNVKP